VFLSRNTKNSHVFDLLLDMMYGSDLNLNPTLWFQLVNAIGFCSSAVSLMRKPCKQYPKNFIFSKKLLL
jgi:hypothetical protein